MSIIDSSLASPREAGRPVAALTTPPSRIGFLDVLRGLATILVFLSHAYLIVPQFGGFTEYVLNIGHIGVAVFFMISGYIIPGSLLRQSLRSFWIRRILRIFPIYWFALSFFVAYGLSGRQIPGETAAAFGAHPPATIAANLALAQYAAGLPNLVPNAWTLHYELVFYAAMAGLLACRLLRHTRATLIAVPAAALALVELFPLTQAIGLRYLGFAIGLMFIGMMFSQLEQGRVSRRFGWIYLAGAVAALLWLNDLPLNTRTAVVPGVLIFSAGYLLRARPASPVLLYLGRISYSIYLIHIMVMVLIPANLNHPHVTVLVWGAATLLVSMITERWIELPAMRLGRDLTRPPAETTG